ncbi:MAG: hypothetical protein M1319_06850 [Chloroflexi bacterium]|nr:hypothetical protein [Chloroflexota bacterium]
MTEPDVTAINIPFPEAADLHLRITVGACRIRITPGEGEAWVTGSYRDPSHAIPCRIFQEGGTVRISQDQNFGNIFGIFSGIPTLELALGKAKAYSLTMETGASEIRADLGGLPLNRFVFKHGAGKTDIDFSSPNPEAMSLLSVGGGAASMEMTNLANANFAEATIDGGAAAYKFDFGGTLQRDAHVRISTGMSSVDVIVPAATAAKITPESVLGGMNIGDGFTKREGAFWTPAATAGTSAVLTIHTNVALGSLNLRLK